MKRRPFRHAQKQDAKRLPPGEGEEPPLECCGPPSQCVWRRDQSELRVYVKERSTQPLSPFVFQRSYSADTDDA